jgi:alkanesulfonate monooxygenase SsuD/methylene tetrahydromethanopterin reductase-like flavin-dependent oxidoreductase (luciferase family)
VDFGVVLQTTPPSARVVDLAKRAEAYGFSHVWTFDSHILWEEPYVIYSQILAETRKVMVGPMVTNPATRDWTVTASVYATLNEMYGNRTICGIGRGDSAVRVTNGAPTTLATLRESVHVIRELANGRSVDYKGSQLRFPWSVGSKLEVWIAAYGPKALALTARSATASSSNSPICRSPNGRSPRSARPQPMPAVTPATSASASPRRRMSPTGVPTRWPTAATSAGGSEGWSATTSPTSSPATATVVGAVPQALTDYIKGREGYDYNEHGQAGNVHTQFVPDDIVDRFCIIGPVEQHIDRMVALKELGVDQFSIYLQHDDKDHTLQAYGDKGDAGRRGNGEGQSVSRRPSANSTPHIVRN